MIHLIVESFSVFITFSCEKTRSSFPLETGSEKSNSAKTKMFNHSDETGKLKILH